MALSFQRFLRSESLTVLATRFETSSLFILNSQRILVKSQSRWKGRMSALATVRNTFWILFLFSVFILF